MTRVPQRVVVTGGAGFIGRQVVHSLLEAGHEVTVVDKDPVRDDVRDHVRGVAGDLREESVRLDALAPGTDAVVHLAAETSVLGSMRDPARVHANNVEVTAGLVEVARQRGIGCLALASSNAVCGPHDGTLHEQLPLRPLTPYGATKAACEMVLWGYAGAFGVRTPMLRLTNVFGRGMEVKDSFIARLCRAAAQGEGVQIYGDGSQRRDLVDVEDVARGFLAALSRPDDWPSGPVVIGSGVSHTVLAMTEQARATTGCEIPATHVDPKPGEMPAVIVTNELARSRGWEPSVDLELGMEHAWASFGPASS